MKYLTLLAFMLVLLLCLTISCERIPAPDKAFNLGETELINLESIPLEYGKLVSVTSARPGIAHLWFEDGKHTIRMVHVNYGKGVVPKNVWVINRK